MSRRRRSAWRITYQETACPAGKDQRQVDASRAGKADWERGAKEKVRRMHENAEAEGGAPPPLPPAKWRRPRGASGALDSPASAPR